MRNKYKYTCTCIKVIISYNVKFQWTLILLPEEINVKIKKKELEEPGGNKIFGGGWGEHCFQFLNDMNYFSLQ